MNKTINISLPSSLLADIQELVKLGEFASISDAIRHAARTALVPKYTINKVRMTPHMKRIARIAEKEFLAGKTKAIKSLDDLL